MTIPPAYTMKPFMIRRSTAIIFPTQIALVLCKFTSPTLHPHHLGNTNVLNTKKKTGCLAIFCFPTVSHVAVVAKLDEAKHRDCLSEARCDICFSQCGVR
ncbi:hypothetical protein CRENBAI_025773 [Crenichthys baileyi]|uniref:Secreted protein n=1 Tax=Crenichthys baileyi TaxID=28760 RepID=A0AAV9RHL4_9TELE